jgi:hypothetical protein
MAAKSGFGGPIKKNLRPPPPTRVDRLKIFTLDWKDWLSFAECLGSCLKGLICKKKKKTTPPTKTPNCGNNYPTSCNNIQFIYICKLLYLFRVVSAPFIRSSYHCTVIPRLTKIIHSGITFVSRNLRWPKRDFS